MAFQRRKSIELRQPRCPCFCFGAEILRSFVGDRLEVVFRKQHGPTRGFEALFQEARDGEVQHRLLHGPVVVADEVAFFHPRPFTADVAGVERDALEG